MLFPRKCRLSDLAHQLSKSIEDQENELGIQFCGTGNGINMSTINIKAFLCWNTHAEQSRLHNDANILTMPARHLQWKEVLDIVKIFISTKFRGRHERRVKKNILSLVLFL